MAKIFFWFLFSDDFLARIAVLFSHLSTSGLQLSDSSQQHFLEYLELAKGLE